MYKFKIGDKVDILQIQNVLFPFTLQLSDLSNEVLIFFFFFFFFFLKTTATLMPTMLSLE